MHSVLYDNGEGVKQGNFETFEDAEKQAIDKSTLFHEATLITEETSRIYQNGVLSDIRT